MRKHYSLQKGKKKKIRKPTWKNILFNYSFLNANFIKLFDQQPTQNWGFIFSLCKGQILMFIMQFNSFSLQQEFYWIEGLMLLHTSSVKTGISKFNPTLPPQ